MGVGRANQRQRTRRALVDAARSLASNGRQLTIVEVAEAAQVSSATAYRYFSNPQDLLLETMIVSVPEIMNDLPDDPAERIDELVRRLAEHQFSNEALWRAMLQASLGRWSQQAQLGPESQVPIRGRIRLEMTQQALAPLADKLSPDLHRKLIMATMLVCGMEALVAARDACGLEPDEAKEVMRWAAQALLHAAVAELTPACDHARTPAVDWLTSTPDPEIDRFRLARPRPPTCADHGTPASAQALFLAGTPPLRRSHW